MNPIKRTHLKLEVKAVFGILFLFMMALNSEAQKLTDTIRIKEVKVFGKKKIEEAGTMTTHIDTLVLQMLKTQTISELLSSYTPVFIKFPKKAFCFRAVRGQFTKFCEKKSRKGECSFT